MEVFASTIHVAVAVLAVAVLLGGVAIVKMSLELSTLRKFTIAMSSLVLARECKENPGLSALVKAAEAAPGACGAAGKSGEVATTPASPLGQQGPKT